MNLFTKKLSLFTLLLITVSSCQAQDTAQDSSIGGVLDALNQRTYQDAFVIFETVQSGHFIQFFNSEEGLYFDFTVQSVSVSDSPDNLLMSEILDSPPPLEGDLLVNEFITKDQKNQLRELLKDHSLNFNSTYQIGLEPNTNEIVGYFEIIRGRFSIEQENYDQFIHDVFEKGFGLTDFNINYIEN